MSKKNNKRGPLTPKGGNRFESDKWVNYVLSNYNRIGEALVRSQPSIIPLVISKHGFLLSYIDAKNQMVQDGEASYVDDLLDCFDTWDEHGSLKAYCIKQFQRELIDFDANKGVFVGNEDGIEAAREVLLAKIRLLEGEDEQGLLTVLRAYRGNPRATIPIMLKAAMQRRRFFTIDVNHEAAKVSLDKLGIKEMQ